MLYKALKTASWQINLQSVVRLTEGESVELDDESADLMVKAGYVEPIIVVLAKEEKPVKQDKELKPVTKNKKA